MTWIEHKLSLYGFSFCMGIMKRFILRPSIWGRRCTLSVHSCHLLTSLPRVCYVDAFLWLNWAPGEKKRKELPVGQPVGRGKISPLSPILRFPIWIRTVKYCSFNPRPGRGGRFCPPLKFFADIKQTNRLTFTSFSVPDQKWTAHLLKKKKSKIGS